MLSTEGVSDAPTETIPALSHERMAQAVAAAGGDHRIEDTDTLHVRMARWPGPDSDFVELEAFDGRSLGGEYAAWHEHDGGPCLAIFAGGGTAPNGETRRERVPYSTASLLAEDPREEKLSRHLKAVLSGLRRIVREHLAERDRGPVGANVWAVDHLQGHWPISKDGGVQFRIDEDHTVDVGFTRDGRGVEVRTMGMGGRMAISPTSSNVVEVRTMDEL